MQGKAFESWENQTMEEKQVAPAGSLYCRCPPTDLVPFLTFIRSTYPVFPIWQSDHNLIAFQFDGEDVRAYLE